MAKIENVEKWGRKTARERYPEEGEVKAKSLPLEPEPSTTPKVK